MYSTDLTPVQLDEKTGRRKYFCQAAADLGVSYQHLWAVLAGKRKSDSLLRRISDIHPELLDILSQTTKQGAHQ